MEKRSSPSWGSGIEAAGLGRGPARIGAGEDQDHNEGQPVLSLLAGCLPGEEGGKTRNVHLSFVERCMLRRPAEGQDVEGRNISDLIAIRFKARRSPTKCLTA